jgi:hypothetical protein
MQTPGAVVHWLSLVHGWQENVVVLQIGVLPEQPVSLLLSGLQATHWPALGLPLALGTHLVPAPVAPLPPSATPPSTLPVQLAPVVSQPTHWFCTQKAFDADGQSVFFTHWTQLPVALLHTGIVPEHTALTPPSMLPAPTPPSMLPALAQETQVFSAEQNGLPAALLHWLLVLHATQRLFTQ